MKGIAAAEWRQFVQLSRNFWRRFFENDLLCREADVGLGISHIFAVIALIPGFLAPFLLKLKYMALAAMPPAVVEPYTWEDKVFFVAYSMTIIGLLGIMLWESLFLDRRDFLILSSLPIRLRTVCLAKFAAVLFFPAVFLLAVIHLSPLLMAFLVLPVPTMTEPGRYLVAHTIAVLSSGIFLFFSIAALPALLVNLLGYRRFRRVSGYVQFTSAWLVLSLASLYPKALAGFDPSRGIDHTIARFFPPMWFLGLFQVLLGRGEIAFRQLAAVAVHALAIAVCAALLGMLAMYLFRTAEIREYQPLPAHGSAPRSRSGFIISGLLNQHVLGHPQERAVFHFMRQTLFRSPGHRLILTCYAGAGFAFAVDGLFALLSGRALAAATLAPLLSVQLILSFFLLSGMRFLFTLPAEVRANWIFRLTETDVAHPYFSGMRKAMYLGILPGVLLMPASAFLLGWKAATVHLFYGMACSLLLVELLLVNFRKIPFTCTYLPGKAQLLTRWVFYWFGFSLYAYQLAALEDWALGSAWRILPLIMLLLMLTTMFRWWNRRKTEVSGLVFEEQPESLCVLNLSEL